MNLPKVPESFLTLMAGQTYVGTTNQRIYTVLGSCVCVILWNQQKNFMAMNHYLLPRGPAGIDDFKYGSCSTPYLLAMLKKLSRSPFSAVIIGGGDVIPLKTSGLSIGQLNIAEAENFLRLNKVHIKARLTGGLSGRRVWFSPEDHLIKILSHEKGKSWQTIPL